MNLIVPSRTPGLVCGVVPLAVLAPVPGDKTSLIEDSRGLVCNFRSFETPLVTLDPLRSCRSLAVSVKRGYFSADAS